MSNLTYGSVCSGIEAASIAWGPMGWKPAWFAEVEKFPSAVLDYHWPEVTNLGDMTTIKDKVADGEVVAPDVLVGGTPCQAFSVAGLRESLDDERGQLTLEYVRILNAIDDKRIERGEQPAICVWENVPGCLNTKDNAFGCFLGALSGEEGELQPPGKKWGHSGVVVGPQREVTWRLIDAQYTGVAQRRKRVFVVASARKDISTREVLFEFEGVQRHTPPSRETQPTAVTDAETGVGETSVDPVVIDRAAFNQGANALYVPKIEENAELMPALVARGPHAVATVVHGTQDPIVSDELAHALGRNGGQENALVLPIHDKATRYKGGGDSRNGDGAGNGLGIGDPSAPMYTLTSGDKHGVFTGLCVRRLTPTECERLQGFPDGHTNIPFGRTKFEDQQAPDGHRYKALGNSMATTVMKWIGKRIDNEVTNA